MNRNYLFYVGHNYSFAILRPLQEEIRKQGHTVKWFFSGSGATSASLTEDEEHIATLRDIYRYRPDAIFAPGNYIPTFLPGIKVALFHGFNVGKRPDHKGHFNIRGCFDLYCTQGPNTTETFLQLAKKHGYFNVVETGWCTLDPLFNNTTNLANKNQDKKTILMCSTFTPRLSCAHVLYDTIKELRDRKDWQWLVQFHPKMDADVVARFKGLENEHLTFIETDNMLPWLAKADVMLCDTSSILLMFQLQDRPVVTFRNNRPGDYLINVTDIVDIEQALETALLRPADKMAEIAKYNAELHPYQDGLSSQRVLSATNELIASKRAQLKRKPLKIIKNLKQLYKLRAKL